METLSLSTLSTQVADIVERAAQAVVVVDARQRRPASGIVFGSDLVVTADHVVERDDHISVRAGDRTLAATLVGRDPASDVALLRVQGLGGSELPRSDAARAGQLVLSVSRTPSGGISAGLGVINSIGGPLRTLGGVAIKTVMRTDAAARPGTSGGAIVDAAGSVIGMTTSALVRGLPIAIPMTPLSEIVAALASSTPPKRAYLGVSLQPVRFARPTADGTDRGLLVFAVVPDGAADRAGVLVGDVIVGFDGERILRSDDLQDRLAGVDVGARGTLSIVRGGVTERLEVTLGARPSA